MNEREEKLLLDRLHDLTKLLRQQHRLPKSKRDQDLIKSTKVAITTVSEWLGKSDSLARKIIQKKPGKITKVEFKEHLSSIMNLAPGSIMVVNDVETLNQIWWTALANNISLQLNENNAALMKRFKQLVRQHKEKALRQRG
jgi:hypothetical protein